MNRMTVGRLTEILLVEDNLDDARVTIEALQSENVLCRVSLVRDGEEAMSFLHREGVFAERRAPTWSFWIWSCRRRTAARCCPRSAATNACRQFPCWC